MTNRFIADIIYSVVRNGETKERFIQIGYHKPPTDKMCQLTLNQRFHAEKAMLISYTYKEREARKINEIAKEILEKWPNIFAQAYVYLEGMFYVESLSDEYGADDGRYLVNGFLSNASHWRGDDARRIKKELNDLLQQ